MRGEIWGRQHRTQPARGSRLRSLPDSLAVFPLPQRSVLRRHLTPSLFLHSLVDSTPDLCCYLQTFFLFLFFPPTPASLFFLEWIALKPANNYCRFCILSVLRPSERRCHESFNSFWTQLGRELDFSPSPFWVFFFFAPRKTCRFSFTAKRSQCRVSRV